MHLLPMSLTDSQAHSPYFRDLVFLNPLAFTATLCSERWEHCHSLSAHLSYHSQKHQENTLWTVSSHHL